MRIAFFFTNKKIECLLAEMRKSRKVAQKRLSVGRELMDKKSCKSHRPFELRSRPEPMQ